MAKRSFFVFILEVLNMESTVSFFAQKEPASTTTPTLMGRRCQSCGRNFASRKSYTRHTCMSGKKMETEAMSTNAPEESCLVPETEQELASDVTPITPPSPPTPAPPPVVQTIDHSQFLEVDENVVYFVTQYCRSCNQKHNEGPYKAQTDEPPGTEVITNCPTRGHRLFARVYQCPVDVESTGRDPRY